MRQPPRLRGFRATCIEMGQLSARRRTPLATTGRRRSATPCGRARPLPPLPTCRATPAPDASPRAKRCQPCAPTQTARLSVDRRSVFRGLPLRRSRATLDHARDQNFDSRAGASRRDPSPPRRRHRAIDRRSLRTRASHRSRRNSVRDRRAQHDPARFRGLRKAPDLGRRWRTSPSPETTGDAIGRVLISCSWSARSDEARHLAWFGSVRRSTHRADDSTAVR
jgi:hypothetical protein